MSHAMARTSGPLFLALLASGCQTSPSPKLPEPVAAEFKSAAAVGLSLAIVDEAVDPCVDFYQYACGGWPTGGKQLADRLEEAHEKLATNRATQLRTPGTPANEALQRCLAETDDEREAALVPIHARIDSIRNRRDHATVLAELDQVGAGAYFELSIGSTADDDDPLLMIRPRAQPTDATAAEIANALTQFEPDDATRQARASAVADVIAKLGSAQSGDIRRVDRAGLGGLAPTFEWDNYLAAVSKSTPGIGTDAPGYIERFGELTAQTPLSVLRDHLRWSLAVELRPFIDVVGDQPARCAALVRQEFADRLVIGPSNRAVEVMEAQMKRVSEALESSAANREWRGANENVGKNAVSFSVASPPSHKGSAPPLGDGGFLANVLTQRRAHTAAWFGGEQPGSSSVVGGPLADGSHVEISPVLMVPPLFDPSASDSINLGRVTATLAPVALELIGHQFSDEDREALAARAQCFAPLEGDDRATAAATVGALAFVASNHAATPPAVRTQSHTADQLFFLGFAQASCTKNGGEMVNRSVANVSAFSTAFECPANTAMNPAERCDAW